MTSPVVPSLAIGFVVVGFAAFFGYRHWRNDECGCRRRADDIDSLAEDLERWADVRDFEDRCAPHDAAKQRRTALLRRAAASLRGVADLAGEKAALLRRAEAAESDWQESEQTVREMRATFMRTFDMGYEEIAVLDDILLTAQIRSRLPLDPGALTLQSVHRALRRSESFSGERFYRGMKSRWDDIDQSARLQRESRGRDAS